MKDGSRLAIRRVKGAMGIALSAACASAIALTLVAILGYIIREGIGAVSLAFLTEIPRPVGVPGGGVANGIVGSVIVVGIAALMAFPVGLLAGIFLAVYGRGWLAESIRFLADVLASVPSIAIGLFAYTVLVRPLGHFSALSASLAFAVLMMPLVIRTTEQAVAAVPAEIREAALALGIGDYHTTTRFVLPAARPGIVTGMLLATARVTGETAPLLFTAFGSQFWQFNPMNPMAELSLQIFTYAISPYRSWHQQAWGGAFILILAVFVLNVLARMSLAPRTVARRPAAARATERPPQFK